MANEPKQLTFDHQDGRICHYSRMSGYWFHWDNPEDNPNPGPLDRFEYRCKRQHPGDSSQMKEDRGEFGMPTLGAHFRNGPATASPVPKNPKVERVCNIMDEAQTLYVRKAAGYKGVEGDTADHLGVKGQFADINRKFWRLKAMLWDEVVPMYPDAGAGENAEEILMDLIGHAALTIDYLREEEGKA